MKILLIMLKKEEGQNFLGLADGVGSINEVIKEKFGKKAKIKIIDQKKSFLQKRLSSSINSNDIFNRLEEMIMWSRYGL
jgi:ubiquinone/menaquinone biosynthesis C-methylase UbiE